MKRYKHSLSHYRLVTCDMGELVPIGLTEVLPGDTVQHATSALIRCAPLMFPVMHPVHVRIHHWFVPHRLVWEDFEKFITGGPDGMDDSVFPYIEFNPAPAVGSLADYLSVPTGTVLTGAEAPSALPFRGYSMIFNEYYRDQDLVTALTIDKTSGVDTTTNVALQKVAWEKDYYTTARLWTQKGPDVTVPLGGTVPVNMVDQHTKSPLLKKRSDHTIEPANNYAAVAGTAELYSATSSLPCLIDPNETLEADLGSAQPISINALRECFALQRYEEARARYGSRYTEYLRYLGVRSSDARLQRPEYLGGGRQTIQFSEVLQTGVTTSGSADGVGNYKGHGIGALRSNRYRRFFEEHGYVFSLMSILPKSMYVTGMPRHWSYRTKEDFFQRELQHIGQQEVYNRELYVADSAPGDVFGYQDRYDHLRRMESGVSGEFRSTLTHAHLARIFGGDVTLNDTFVTADPAKRIFASTNTDGLWIMASHSMQARRMVAPTGTSMII